ncbi:MAG: Rne/Rng family ribonuclease [Acidimicrobiales bacterium]
MPATVHPELGAGDRQGSATAPVEGFEGVDLGDIGLAKPAGRGRRRSGRERRGKPVGRYLMCVHVRPHATQIAVLEGRTLVEHFVSRASDDTSQIDGNIYLGRVQNVLPGMEAAFVDIDTPKNAVLYRGDVRYDREDIETQSSSGLRIEQMLRPGQMIVCQVTKNPIGAKGARLTQEVSLPGRFVVMVPNSSAFGISKRLDDPERRRLRRIVDEIRPAGHGLIVRTAAAGASLEELRHDVERLCAQWSVIEAEAARANTPRLLYREPDLGVRIVREELNNDYRAVIIDDQQLYEQVRDYVAGVNPELVDRIEHYDTNVEPLPLFERYHVHEQLHKALDRKVWLPSGGSIIIERTEALTVIDVNTGKNVGTSNLEETVYRNNLEAAEEIARQLRLRDIGGIIVIDFIDMEIRENRDKVGAALRAALARDKTRAQVYEISELGLVEMTRKRVSEGLVESLSTTCTVCGGRGIMLDESLL